jgi:epoxide hydrolase 4
MAAFSTRYIAANGLKFETDIAGDGDRFALLLHGFPENKYSWRFQLPFLAKRGFTAWAPNLRGYGRSDRPKRRAAYRLRHLIDDAAALIAAAKSERAYRQTVLIGHDWGGLIAFATQIESAVGIDKLVIMNVPHPALFRHGLNSFAQLKRSWYIWFFQLPWLPELALARNKGEAIGTAFGDLTLDKSNFGEADLAIYRAAAQDPGALSAMIGYYRANLGEMHKISRRDQPPLDVPTLMVWGENDIALGKELTYGTERYVRKLTIRYLPGVSHWVQQEAPAVVNAMLGAFIDGNRVPSAEELAKAI